MTIFLQLLWLKKIKLYLDTLWLVGSMLAVPGLLGVTAYWLTGAGHSASVTSTPTSVHASPGAVTKIKPTVTVTTGARTIYRLTLVDANGVTVCVYPDISPADSDTPDFGNILIRVPDTLSQGSYRLFADIVYAVNPIKSGVVRVKVADVTVDKEG